MRNMLKIALEGAFTNFKRIFFAADRVTDMQPAIDWIRD